MQPLGIGAELRPRRLACLGVEYIALRPVQIGRHHKLPLEHTSGRHAIRRGELLFGIALKAVLHLHRAKDRRLSRGWVLRHLWRTQQCLEAVEEIGEVAEAHRELGRGFILLGERGARGSNLAHDFPKPGHHVVKEPHEPGLLEQLLYGLAREQAHVFEGVRLRLGRHLKRFRHELWHVDVHHPLFPLCHPLRPLGLCRLDLLLLLGRQPLELVDLGQQVAHRRDALEGRTAGAVAAAAAVIGRILGTPRAIDSLLEKEGRLLCQARPR